MERIIKGPEDSISYNEADEMANAAMGDILAFMVDLVDLAEEKEGMRANAKVNLTSKLGNLAMAYEMRGVLSDPESYLKRTFPEGYEVTIEDAM